jgi:two-component system, OmpR family, sensor kinase
MISRLPIRLRLTLPFALVMAVVLAATGFLIYRRVGSTLLASIDRGLRGQALEAASRVERGQEIVDRDAPEGPSLGQVLNAEGTVRASTPAGLGPLLSGVALGRVLAGHRSISSGHVQGREGDWRIIAVPGRLRGEPVAVVVASSLDAREQTLDRLLSELLLGGPLALLVATLAGYGLATSAFRPVEAMRLRAASIGGVAPGSRLPVPRSRDELSRLAETLNDMLARLEAAFEHERRFVDDASHELRTPLALLRTELELALRRPRPAAELEQALRSSAEETERLSRLAEDLLLFARFDQGRLPLRRETLGVQQLLEGVAGRFERRAESEGRSIRVEAPAGLRIDADEVRLEQALGNLVENALSHGAGAVVLYARAENRRVELHVSDEGPGIAAEFVPRAFDRFSRSDEGRGRGGTGLGLAMVQLIANAHGGEAGIANRNGSGTDAWVSLEKP